VPRAESIFAPPPGARVRVCACPLMLNLIAIIRELRGTLLVRTRESWGKSQASPRDEYCQLRDYYKMLPDITKRFLLETIHTEESH